MLTQLKMPPVFLPETHHQITDFVYFIE